MPSRHPWIRVATFASGWEAELAVTRLDAEGVPARSMGNDLVGIFGPGFQGANARGFFVEVPEPFVAQARVVLSRPAAAADGMADDAEQEQEQEQEGEEQDWGDDEDDVEDEEGGGGGGGGGEDDWREGR